MDSKVIFEKMVGQWNGVCRTWFEPGKLADESKISGTISSVLAGQFLRHTYVATIQRNSREGEEMIAFNSVTKKFQSSWVDGFHMNYAILFSEGKSHNRGFQVRGNYDVGENEPQWGWRTEYQLLSENELIIAAYNIHPEGMEAMAIETVYRRG